MIDIKKLFHDNPTKYGLIIGCNNSVDFMDLINILHSMNILEKDLYGSRDSFVLIIANSKAQLYYNIASKHSLTEEYYSGKNSDNGHEKYIIMDYFHIVHNKSLINQIEDNLDKLYERLL